MIGDIMLWEYGTIEELYTFHNVRKGRALEKSKGQHAPEDIKHQVSPSVITQGDEKA